MSLGITVTRSDDPNNGFHKIKRHAKPHARFFTFNLPLMITPVCSKVKSGSISE